MSAAIARPGVGSATAGGIIIGYGCEYTTGGCCGGPYGIIAFGIGFDGAIAPGTPECMVGGAG